MSIAVRYSTFGTMSAAGTDCRARSGQYGAFARAYGHDVMDWAGFETLRDIRELRVTCYAAQRASENEEVRDEAALRVASLRGLRGARPWPEWKPLS